MNKMFNSKKGQNGPGLWIIAIIIYFTLFIGITTGVSNIASEVDSGSINAYTIDKARAQFATSKNSYVCQNPRLVWDPLSRTPIVSDPNEIFPKKFQAEFIFSNLDCNINRGVFLQSHCEAMNGCTWENTTYSGFDLFNWSTWFGASDTSIETCTGVINSSYYGINSSIDSLSGDEHVTEHSYTDIETRVSAIADHFNIILEDIPLSSYWDDGYTSVCNHNETIFDQAGCEFFSCYWGPVSQMISLDEIESANYEDSADDIISVVGDLLTFSYDYGIENQTVNSIVNFIFVGFPILILIIAFGLIMTSRSYF